MNLGLGVAHVLMQNILEIGVRHNGRRRRVEVANFLFVQAAVITLVLINSGLAAAAVSSPSRPHIVFILADDLGWNDVGFHGSAQIPTPNIDALAYSGLILNRYYVNPICTPTRSALMTAKYPIHTGMQHTVLMGAEPRGLPLTEKLLPEYLNQFGYSSHMAGKWHLGHFQRIYTPLYRGFKSHIGYWTGHHDYFDHTAVEHGSWGLDMRNGLDVAYDMHGKYTTDVITDESVRVIKNHNASTPLFLYVAHAGAHSGNPYNPLPAPDVAVAKMSSIREYNRRKFGAIVSKLDDSVGAIVQQLQQKDMLRNTLIVFSTDNGGAAEGFNLNAASNWPLRGVKNTLFEGGVRGAGLLWYPRLAKARRVSEQTMHVADWLPTLLDAAGFQLNTTGLDGMSVWDALSKDDKSPRSEILHNIDDIWGSAALTVGDWKVLRGTNYNGTWDGWYGPSGNRSAAAYSVSAVFNSQAGRAVQGLKLMPSAADIERLRSAANLRCAGKRSLCELVKAPCLFNVRDDPCEQNNLADKYPNILRTLLDTLEAYNRTAVPPGNLPLSPQGDPRYWDNVWTNFGDFTVKVSKVE